MRVRVGDLLALAGDERQALADEAMAQQQNGLRGHALVQQKACYDSPQNTVHSPGHLQAGCLLQNLTVIHQCSHSECVYKFVYKNNN